MEHCSVHHLEIENVQVEPEMRPRGPCFRWGRAAAAQQLVPNRTNLARRTPLLEENHRGDGQSGWMELIKAPCGKETW